METATPSVETAPVTFTKSAMDELHRLQANLALSEDAFLRIGVKGGGCSGMSYLLAFDKKEAGDNEYEVEGVKMVMNKAHVMYVLGMEVDWENGLDNRGSLSIIPMQVLLVVADNRSRPKACRCLLKISNKAWVL